MEVLTLEDLKNSLPKGRPSSSSIVPSNTIPVTPAPAPTVSTLEDLKNNLPQGGTSPDSSDPLAAILNNLPKGRRTGSTSVPDNSDPNGSVPRTLDEQTEEVIPNTEPETPRNDSVAKQYEEDLAKLVKSHEDKKSGREVDSLWLDPSNGILDRWTGGEEGEEASANRDRNSVEWELESLQRTRDEVDILLASSNPMRSNLTKALIASGMSLPMVALTVNSSEFTPFYGTLSGIIDLPESFGTAGDLWEADKKLFSVGLGALSVLEIAAGVVGARGIVRSWKTGVLQMGLGAIKTKGDDGILKAVNAKGLANPRAAEAANTAARLEEADKIVKENPDLEQRYIKDLEEITGKTISDSVDGVLVINPQLVRQAGKETTQQILNKQKNIDGTETTYINELAMLQTGSEDMVMPTLIPDKINPMIAIAADIRKRNPKIFEEVDKNGKPLKLQDILFKAVVNQEGDTSLLPEEFVDMLGKYNLSFEDYTLAVMGSGSTAGEVLSKFSQMSGRLGKPSKRVQLEEKARREAQGKFMKGVQRIEGIRRGLLVSQVATASRNLTSAGIRAPLEGLGNVMETAMANAGKKGAVAGVKSLGDMNNWTDSFRHMKYMFQPSKAKEYTDIILNRPELLDQFSNLLDNLNEIQKSSGRGKGGVGDYAMSKAEDVVGFLNTPNRWQEHLVRRGAFLGELQRLTNREWGVDIIDVIDRGEFKDLLNDSSRLKPKDGRSFVDMIESSTRKALDVTYAKAPDTKVFRETANFITRNGLTVVIPFPRFMFNSMEIMGNYAGGASIPLTKKMMNIVTGGKAYKGETFTAMDRERVSRNILGFAAVGAAYSYRTSDDAPSDYKKMAAGDGAVIDTTPQFPIRQFLFLGESAKRLLRDKTFDNWFDVREFSETFLGTNIRVGVGEGLIQEVADLATGVDLTDDEAAGKTIGKALGNYLSTWVVPFGQIIDLERGLGYRGTEYKESTKDSDLTFGGGLSTAFDKPFRSRGVSILPSTEAALPKKQYVLTENKKRIAPFVKLLFGVSLTTGETEEGEYISNLGYTEMDVSSRSKVPSVRNFENEMIRKFLPAITDVARKQEKKHRLDYRNFGSGTKIKQELTEEQYVNSYIRKQIDDGIKIIKGKLSSGKLSKASPLARTIGDYRKLSSEVRALANTEYIKRYGKVPDPTDINDLRALSIMGKRLSKIGRKIK